MTTTSYVQDQPTVTVVCNHCHTPHIKPLFTHYGFTYGQCVQCGLVRCQPQLTPAAIDALYALGYQEKSSHLAPEKPTFIPQEYRYILDQLAQWRGKTGYLLEIGCFEGQLLHAAQQMGWQVEGTEITVGAVNMARQQGLTVHLGLLPDLQLPSQSYDAIILRDVIEHLPDPSATLDEIYRLLKPNGVLYLWTPNFDALARRVAGRHWGAVIFPMHLSFFTPLTLSNMVKKSGFFIRDVTTINWLLDFRDRHATIFEAAPLRPSSPLLKRMERLLNRVTAAPLRWLSRHRLHLGAQITLFAQKQA